MTDEQASCQWCGGDGYFEWELKDGKCETCIVQDCCHQRIERMLISDIGDEARFQESCIECGVFRITSANFIRRKLYSSPWNHDDVRMDDIQ